MISRPKGWNTGLSKWMPRDLLQYKSPSVMEHHSTTPQGSILQGQRLRK